MKKNLVNKVLNRAGFELQKPNPYLRENGVFKDMEPDFEQSYLDVKNYSMTTVERLYSAYKAAEYVSANNIPGDIVECGVWKGGSSMMMIKKMIAMKDNSRDFYLYDTFEGMSEPTEKDKTLVGENAFGFWKKSQVSDHNDWCYASIDEVQKNVASCGYDSKKIHFVKGKVEDTIPNVLPKAISLLRLDTDWYESTYHEMKHLFPLLSVGGVLIIDDYGHWEGARQAVDEYIKEKNIRILLNRIDYTGRIGIKLHP